MMDALRRGKRILFLAPQLPFPPESGAALRNFNLISQVARRHLVSLLAFCQPGDADAAWPLAAIGQVYTVARPERSMADRMTTLFTTRRPDMADRLASQAFVAQLRHLLDTQTYDIIQIEGIEMAPYGLMAREWLGDACPALIYDAHNAEYVMQQRAFQSDARIPKRWLGAVYSLIQWRRLARYEAALMRACAGTVCCSDADAAALHAIAPEVSPLVLPNGVDTRRYHPDLRDSLLLDHPAIVFTGKMDFRPNVDGMLWFADAVWPKIAQARPDARLYIVGKSPGPALAPLGELPGVTLTGYVPEIMPYFGGADVYVVPLRVGGGTRLKVLEAMAAGVALVSTRLGSEGIDVTHDENLILADEADDFAAGVLALLDDPTRRDQLGHAARQFAVDHYDWSSLAPRLDALYEAL